ncbi:hypothetical protein RB653_009887 [Dictyostelium firmibasis]|uniref:Phosphatidic acid phosphatase type 2/haloperoxidase domain-containing protein n=1 Tax=Dictyostelium firmibasis TaxID=79012 RepID=A0AAN7TKQ2_9MYCE
MKKILYENQFDKPLFYDYDFRKKNKKLVYIIDWFCVLVILLIGFFLFLKVPVRGRLFRLNDESISYPKLTEIISLGLLIPLVTVIPFLIILFISIVIKRDLNDFHHSLLGFCQSISITLLLTGSFKTFIGGLRPSFLEFCKPTIQSIAQGNPPVGYGSIYYDKSICTESEFTVNDGLSAYPSGHSSIAATCFGFLALYLFARLKCFDNRGHVFIYLLVIGCLISAGLIGISRVADYHHTFLNVLAGWSIGLIIALSCYRLNFSSLFGHDNHISIHSHWLTYWDYHNNNKNNNDQNRIQNNIESYQSPNGISLNELS